MNGRSPEDFNHERQALDHAHIQNEAGRDAFVALAHTALFAASVAFVGDVAPLTGAIWKPALITGWAAHVIGLFALTISFSAARRATDARRKALNDTVAPHSHFAEILNWIALWSFPVALLCLFSFVTANVVTADEREARSPTALTAVEGGKGDYPAPKSPSLRRRAETLDRGDPGSADSAGPASTTPAAAEGVTRPR